MESFIDNEAEILWYKDEVGYEKEQINDELNSWESKAIDTYVSGGLNLPYLFESVMDFEENTELFYGYIYNKLVSTVLMKENKQLQPNAMVELINHLENNRINANCQPKEKTVSDECVKKTIDNRKYNDIYYLVVNPTEQGKGYGTRIVSSIKHNLGFFIPHIITNDDVLGTSIHFTNHPSKAIFRNNGFKRLNVQDTKDNRLKLYLLDEDEMEK